MNTKRLALDYLRRARVRRRALEVLVAEGAYADVVREAQEILELVLKGVLRYIGVEPPKRHDVGAVLKENATRLPAFWQEAVDEAVLVSRDLMDERSHAFYGDEVGSIPASELFTREDAESAIATVDRFIALFERLAAGEGQ